MNIFKLIQSNKPLSVKSYLIGYESYLLTVVALSLSFYNFWSNIIARSRDRKNDEFQNRVLSLLTNLTHRTQTA